jgi:hypothetical protein
MWGTTIEITFEVCGGRVTKGGEEMVERCRLEDEMMLKLE